MAVQDTGLILLGFATLRRGIISVRGASGCSALYHAPPWLLFHFRSIIFLNTCFDFAFKCLLNQLISALEYTPCHSTASAVTCGGSCPYLFKNDFSSQFIGLYLIGYVFMAPWGEIYINPLVSHNAAYCFLWQANRNIFFTRPRVHRSLSVTVQFCTDACHLIKVCHRTFLSFFRASSLIYLFSVGATFPVR